MKAINSLPFALGLALVAGFAACGKKEKPADAAQPLQESFQSAQPEVQQAVASITTNLKAKNYTEATRALAPIVSAQQLTDPQKQAVSVALQQINQAVAADPKLDTKEMYELRVKMFQAVRKGSRF